MRITKKETYTEEAVKEKEEGGKRRGVRRARGKKRTTGI